MASKSSKKYFEAQDTDKALNGSFRAYDRILGDIRFEPLNILEIGCGSTQGGLLGLKYYCENANLYGIDIKKDKVDPKDASLKLFLIDSTDIRPGNVEMIESVFGDIKFDLIIDDGLHTPQANKLTMKNFLPYLKEDGYYLIEDMRMTLKPLEFDNLPSKIPFYGRGVKDTADYLNLLEKADVFGYEVTHFDLREEGKRIINGFPEQMYHVVLHKNGGKN